MVKKVVDALARAEVFEVRFFGGEFFTYPQWPAVVEYAFKQGMFMSFVSNGTLLTPKAADTLLKFGITTGTISIHGPENIHDLITRKPGSFQRAVRGLRACLDAGLKITVLTTLTRRNKDRLSEMMISLSEQVLITESFSYGVSRLCPFGRGREDWENTKLSLQDYLIIFPVLEQIASQYGIATAFGDAFPLCLLDAKYHYLVQGCWQGTGFGHISWNGEVRGCATADGTYGNLLKVPLEQIWQGQAMTEFRQLKWLPVGCQTCSDFCGGGCSASRPSDKMYAPDEFLEVRSTS
jgi:radical SAM protein with 4Fe4S-binding SPASM domain